MRFFNILFTSLLLFTQLNAQTLFEDAVGSDSSSTNSVSLNSANETKVIKKDRPIIRLLSTNLESVIARGDIHFLYESPQDNGWSTMTFIHANPQSQYNGQTGDYGAMIGGRSYLDNTPQKSSVFLQGLVGFNHNQRWDLMISVEIGQRVFWKKNIFLDVSLAVNRSYASNSQDPMAYLKANLTFALNNRLIPFL